MEFDISKNGFYDYIVKNVFIKQVNDTIKEHSDVLTHELLKRVDFRVRRTELLTGFMNTIISPKPSGEKFSKKQLYTLAKEYKNHCENVACWAYYRGNNDENGIFHINDMKILVNNTALAKEILSNLGWIDTFVEIIKVDAMHEVGHLIDYIMTIEGKPKKELEEEYTEEIRLKEEFYKWRDNEEKYFDNLNLGERCALLKKTSGKYYELPWEWRADCLTGVDRGRYLDMLYDPKNYKKTLLKVEGIK